MTMLFPSLRRKQDRRTAPQVPVRAPSLTRSFVLTGDERCPIAGIWMSLTPPDAPSEDPELPRPVTRISSRLLHPLFTSAAYPPA